MMQNRTLPSSLLIAAALVLPSVAIAAPVNTADIQPADARTMPADNTLQAQVEGPDGELLATQPGAVDTAEIETAEVEVAEAEAMPDVEATADVDMAAVEATKKTPEAIKAVALEPAQTVSADATSAQTLNKQHSAANYQPLIKGEARGNVTPADASATATPVTLKEKKKDKRGELLATQPADVELGESRRIVVR